MTKKIITQIIGGMIIITIVVGLAVRHGIFDGKLKNITERWSISGENSKKDVAAKQSVPGKDLIVTKVIDGDTVVAQGGDHVRLLGMDADEKGYPCYEAAKNRLEELVLGKSVKLESDGSDKDQYGRLLRYIFVGNENVDEKLVAEGLAVARFYPENQKYKAEIGAAEAEAMKNKTGCKWSGREQTAGPQSAPPIDAKNLAWKTINGNAIDACDAKNHIGESIIVQGTVADSYSSAAETVFFDFSKAYPNNCFSAVVFKSNTPKFSGSPETIYKLKTVRVRGTVQEYQGKPEIIISDPLQIEIGS
jgi:micrococcal nuclease